MLLKKILSYVRMYILNFDSNPPTTKADIEVRERKYYSHTVPCKVCGQEYFKCYKARHYRSKEHMKAVELLKKKIEDLYDEIRAIRQILNSPQ